MSGNQIIWPVVSEPCAETELGCFADTGVTMTTWLSCLSLSELTQLFAVSPTSPTVA